MTEAVVALPLLLAALLALPLGEGARRRVNAGGAVVVAALGAALAVRVLATPSTLLAGSWYAVDPAGAVLVLVIAVVGLLSALASAGAGRRFQVAFALFWAVLLAVPLVDNLAAAWLLLEATTAASALLVASSGRRRALEAGWKYLVLTTLGLAVALLGIVLLYAALPIAKPTLAALDWRSIHASAGALDHDQALLALGLILAGLAAKAGWAPVHNWLPDAHSEAPPAVSAMLSAALLPTVVLVAWRTQVALAPAVGGTGSAALLAFGVLSLAVAVPFLWRPMPLKRLLAYSSLEHMGVLALGIGFATPLASAGVVLHIAGHALAKSLGFYAAIPLLRDDPRLASRPLRGLASRGAASAVGVSLGSLSGLPPSPLFVSELLILLGGIAAGEVAVVAVAAVLLALGFLGLAHALIEGVATPMQTTRGPHTPLLLLTAAVTVALLALAAAGLALPGSALVRHLLDGVA